MSSQSPRTADRTAGRNQPQRSGSRSAQCRRRAPTLSSRCFRSGAETSTSCSTARSFFSAHQASKSGPASDTERPSRVVCLRRVRRTAEATPAADIDRTIVLADPGGRSSSSHPAPSPPGLRWPPPPSGSRARQRLERGRVRGSSPRPANRTVYRRQPAAWTTVTPRQFSSGRRMLQRRTCSPTCSTSSPTCSTSPQESSAQESHAE
mmetsp:Transcript_106269/g.328069  ORF Transcript_106269/g.328069 Transcript_106269/m.328069 type:complete len:207 (+) Transcript_106269:1028-1648(+)